MGKYKQLTEEQRYQLSGYMKAGLGKKAAADLLGVHKSTVHRELDRNSTPSGEYDGERAIRQHRERQSQKVKGKIAGWVWDLVRLLLEQEQWSPWQISDALREKGRRLVSHESIYQFVREDKARGGKLHKELRCQKRRRKKYGSGDAGLGVIKNRVGIENRPKIVDRKGRYGDWEVDTIIGANHQQAIVTLTERKSKLLLMKKVERKTAALVE